MLSTGSRPERQVTLGRGAKAVGVEEETLQGLLGVCQKSTKSIERPMD